MDLKLIVTIFISFSFFCFSTYSSVEMMTLEEKIGQVLVVHFNGKIANEEARTLVQKVCVGGFIYYNWANGLDSPEQVLNLSKSLQVLSSQNRMPIPLFISIDQEGGLVARLTNGFTIFPGNRALAMTGNYELAEQSAFAMGQELNAVGVNFNLSPVVDVNCNPHNPVIGIRSFGNSTDMVVPYAANAIQGYQRAGIITCLKHFPGHGDVEVDSHQDLPVINKSKQELQKVELIPFEKLSSLADTIMTAHVIIPSIDPLNCATLSKSVLDILRNEIGFKGIIISDSLVMEGLLKNCSSVDDAAIKAFNAGCDVLILGGKQLVGAHANLELTVADVERVHTSLVNAVKAGLISETKLNEAVQRILNLKEKYNVYAFENSKDLGLLLNTHEHNLLAKKIASLALRAKENKTITASLNESKIAFFAPETMEDSIKKTALLNLGRETYTQFFKESNSNEEEIKTASEIAKKADLFVFCSYNTRKNSFQASFIHSLSEYKKPLVIISLGDPLDACLFPEASLILTTFSPTVPSLEAACEKLSDFSLKEHNQQDDA